MVMAGLPGAVSAMLSDHVLTFLWALPSTAPKNTASVL